MWFYIVVETFATGVHSPSSITPDRNTTRLRLQKLPSGGCYKFSASQLPSPLRNHIVRSIYWSLDKDTEDRAIFGPFTSVTVVFSTL